jgi:ribosome-interacting GTPase 1
MPTNADYAYNKAVADYQGAVTIEDKIKCLKSMLSTAPSHKGAENLRQDIKEKLKKLQGLLQKEKKASKGRGLQLAVKKEGAAQVAIIGITNSGKSWLINKLTGSKIKEADYPYTTKLPEKSVMDYYGAKIQLIEVPAIFEGLYESDTGPMLLGLMRTADLLVVLVSPHEDYQKQINTVDNELHKGDVKTRRMIITNKDLDLNKFKDRIWANLDVVKVFTKQPGKPKEMPPIAFPKGSIMKDLAERVHKDFIRKFRFARVWGKTAKFQGQAVGLNYVLQDDDVIEFHLK